MGKQHSVKRPTFQPTFGQLVSAHVIISSKTAMMIETPTRTPSSDKRSKNFASEAGSYKVSSKNKSLFSVSMTRNHTGSILYHALQAKVDLE